MGLRINHNITALNALRNLQINNRQQVRVLEHLSTGLRIVRASDDPSGLVISEQLRGQINALEQVTANAQDAQNMINTTEASLQKISDILTQLNDSLIFAMNSGAASRQQIEAEQASVNQAIAAIDRIAQTTRFTEEGLLNGEATFMIPSSVGSQLNDLIVRNVAFPPGVSARTFEISVIQSAARGFVPIGQTSAANTVLRITGPRGTADITVSAVASANLRNAVNAVAGNTGVFASQDPTLGSLAITEEFGTAQVVSIEVVDGTAVIDGGIRAPRYRATDMGQDGVIRLEGISFTGQGRFFDIVSNGIKSLEFNLNPFENTVAIGIGGAYRFRVLESGMRFQLGTEPRSTDFVNVGIDNMAATFLGFQEMQDAIARAVSGNTTLDQGGRMTSILAGNANDLFTNPGNALRIVSRAIDQVNGLRSFLGSLARDTLQVTIDSTEVAIENITASESRIRDLDFAAEVAELTRTQILFQAGVSVLAQANLVPQTVLQLLQ